MRPTHIMADLSVPDINGAREFYQEYLGLTAQDMGLDWVIRFLDPDGRAAVQLVTQDATAQINPAVSVAVGDQVQEAYDEAVRRGYEIVHPLTTEPWGVQRFFVRAPDGNVINIVGHQDPES